jgi:hypothetical protein
MAKKIVFVLIGLVALILFVPAVMKPSFRIERSIEIAQPAEVIFPFVSDFSKWKDWSHWSSTDPGQKVTISGSPATMQQHVQGLRDQTLQNW